MTLSSRDDNIGVCALLAPHKTGVPKQTFSPTNATP